MLDKAGLYWRVFATGLSFALFGVGGLLLRVLAFPLLSLLVRHQPTRVRGARTIIRLGFRLFVGMMRGLGVLRYEIRGLEKLDREGQLIVANHPTLIDTVFLMAFVGNADCIVKGALANNPFTRGPVRAAGYIHNDQGPQLLEDCIDSLRSGGNLIIFPEGTRSPRSAPIALRRGAANIAVRAARPLTPVLIRCQPLTLGKGDKWWRVPPCQPVFSIEVKDDIAVERFSACGVSDVMAARRLTEYLQHYFMEEGQRHA